MPILGLTGGVATGKSTFSKLLLREVGMRFFDSDRCVHELLAEDGETAEAIRKAFGSDVLDHCGRPERGILRDRVFQSDADRKTLEGILHPKVRSRWVAAVAEARKTDAWQLVDIPLLYETGVQTDFDRVIVVASPRAAQIHRMVNERGLSATLAEQIIAAQMDLGTKIQQADHVIWNDSTVFNLDGQTRLLASWLRRRFI